MEGLLNKLIEKGWKPFGEDRIDKINWLEQYAGNWNWGCWSEKNSYWRWKSTRQLVSKESGLWQFVCENGMINNEKLTHTRISQVEWGLDVDCVRKTTSSKYEYRLIESALCDEDKLEEFLLDNIKIDGE